MSYYPAYDIDRVNDMPVCPPNPQLAQAYVPFQQMSDLYAPMEGLDKGTIFPELYRPYGMDPAYVFDA